jgi:hypothetical protein
VRKPWVYREAKEKPATRPSSFNEVRKLEILVPSSDPARVGFSERHDADVTVIRSGSDEDIVIAPGVADAPSVQVIAVTREGQRVSFTGTTAPR